MTGRALSFLVLVSTAACGSGRLVPADTEPASAPPNSGPVAEPAPSNTPTAEPTAQAPTDSGNPAPSLAPKPAVAPQPGVVPQPAPAAAPAAGYAPYDSSSSIAIRRVGQWSTSGITTPARVVIRDDTAYARFWSGLGDAGSRPSVDFTHDIVIAAAAGQQTSGGHSIAIDRVTRVGAGLAIEVTETVPPQGCAVSQALTQPVDVVVVAAADVQTWSFTDRRVPGAC
jgi:hypothetical protein